MNNCQYYIIQIVVFLTVILYFRFRNKEVVKNEKSGCQLLVATFQQMKNPYQLLIIPLTVWSGLEQAFLNADFTAVSIRVILLVEVLF